MAASRTEGYRDNRRDHVARKSRSHYGGGRNSIAEGDWVCSDSTCNNVNFARRLACNLCGREKYSSKGDNKSSFSSSSHSHHQNQHSHPPSSNSYRDHRDRDDGGRERTRDKPERERGRPRDRSRGRDVHRSGDGHPPSSSSSSSHHRRQNRDKSSSSSGSASKKLLGHEIGKSAAEKSRGLFNADDWQCGRCGNVNWARRQQCNMCNGPKFSENEERTGLGGGYNDRDQVEYIRRLVNLPTNLSYPLVRTIYSLF